MPDNMNLDPLFYGVVIPVGVAAIGTPILWRATRGKGRAARVIGTTLGCVALAVGLAFLGETAFRRWREAASFALPVSLVLQGVLLPLLIFLSRKG